MSLAAPDFDWEGEGRRVGEALDSVHSVVVIGVEPDDTALVALGIARSQARRRRVVLADLLGEAKPLQRFVPGDDYHGIVDSFLYGVSLARVSVRLNDPGELYLLPTGTESPPFEEVFTNPRWGRLANGFRERGAMLVIVAAAGAPHIERLTSFTDGAVLVGESVPPELPVARVIASVRMPLVAVPETSRAGPLPPPRPRFRNRRTAAAGGIALTAMIVAIIAWLAWRPLADTGRTAAGRHTDTTTSAGQAEVRSDALRRDSLIASLRDPREPIATNAADSASASAYAISVVNMSTMAGARSKVEALSRRDPAVTYAPVLISNARWFQIRVGAFPTQAAAESLLAAMRAGGRAEPQGGEAVVRAPFAFLLDSLIARNKIGGYVEGWRNLSVPAYALLQADGTFRVYAGAFTSPRESIILADSLRAKGFDAPLVYRIGRVF